MTPTASQALREEHGRNHLQSSNGLMNWINPPPDFTSAQWQMWWTTLNYFKCFNSLVHSESKPLFKLSQMTCYNNPKEVGSVTARKVSKLRPEKWYNFFQVARKFCGRTRNRFHYCFALLCKYLVKSGMLGIHGMLHRGSENLTEIAEKWKLTRDK